MRLCQFDQGRLGIVQGERVYDVTAALAELAPCRYPLPTEDLLIAALPALLPRLQSMLPNATTLPLAEVRLGSPVANPGKIVAAPVNYRKHLQEARADEQLHHQRAVEEIQRVGLFLKATSSLIGASQPILIRHSDRRTDHEIELAVVIGRRCRRVHRAEALSYVAGYCIGLDITLRGPEERSLRKSIDTYSVLGPWLVTADEIADPGNLGLALEVNGESRQQANTRELILSVPELIEYASSFYELRPGDVLMTGTPAGVGPIKPGDHLRAHIESIGTMSVTVRAFAEEGVDR